MDQSKLVIVKSG